MLLEEIFKDIHECVDQIPGAQRAEKRRGRPIANLEHFDDKCIVNGRVLSQDAESVEPLI